jgi:hypothetical protein
VRWSTALFLIWTFVGAYPRLADGVNVIFIQRLNTTTAQLPRTHAELFNRLRELAKQGRPGTRLLFEVSEGAEEFKTLPINPFGSFRLSPLIPDFTGLEVVGGPYLSTHYRTNFTQVGEGKFLGSSLWTSQRFREYAGLYALDLAVLWSPRARLFAHQNAGLFEELPAVGDFHLYRIRREPAPWESAGLRVTADYDQLTIENPKGARGTFILPYHYISGWSGDVAIKPTLQAEDPVPFITLVNPPAHAVLRFSPWRAGR